MAPLACASVGHRSPPRRRPSIGRILARLKLGLLVGVAVLAACTTEAPAPEPEAVGERVDSYAIAVEIDEHDPSRARFELRFDYVSEGPAKREGYKFFGLEPLSALTVTDVDGEPLPFTQPEGYREHRVEWSVPPPRAGERVQTVVVEFEQRLLRSYRWGQRAFALGWADKFEIPVDRMHVSVLASPPIVVSGGFSCAPAGARVRCQRSSEAGSFAVEDAPAGPVDERLPLGLLAGLAVVFALAGGLGLRRLWPIYVDWYGEAPRIRPVKLKDRPRGRAELPDPLPKPSPGKRLGPRGRRRFVAVSASVLLAPALGAGGLAIYGRSPLPLGWSVLGLATISMVHAGLHLRAVAYGRAAAAVWIASGWSAVLIAACVRWSGWTYAIGLASVFVLGWAWLTVLDRPGKPTRSRPPRKRSRAAGPSSVAKVGVFRPPTRPSPSPRRDDAVDFDLDDFGGGRGNCGGCGG